MSTDTSTNAAMSAKEEILARARAALADVTTSDPVVDVPIPWNYHQPVEQNFNGQPVLDVFVERVEDYRATVVRVPASDLADAIAAGLRSTGAHSAVVPSGVDQAWLAGLGDIEVRRDEPTPLSAAELNVIDAVVTGAAVGVAETGTIILDHDADQGRRALTLLPDRHICVVRADQVVSGVPEAVQRLRPAVEARRPQTWISGPSATSDIELSRVEGVHGPRTLYVIVAE